MRVGGCISCVEQTSSGKPFDKLFFEVPAKMPANQSDELQAFVAGARD